MPLTILLSFVSRFRNPYRNQRSIRGSSVSVQSHLQHGQVHWDVIKLRNNNMELIATTLSNQLCRLRCTCCMLTLPLRKSLLHSSSASTFFGYWYLPWKIPWALLLRKSLANADLAYSANTMPALISASSAAGPTQLIFLWVIFTITWPNWVRGVSASPDPTPHLLADGTLESLETMQIVNLTRQHEGDIFTANGEWKCF